MEELLEHIMEAVRPMCQHHYIHKL
jgi:hypothetical protein